MDRSNHEGFANTLTGILIPAVCEIQRDNSQNYGLLNYSGHTTA
jgi:hypothetical protein